MKTIVTPAIFTGFGSRLDKSLSFRGCTPELTSVEKAAFMDFQGLNVRLLIEPVDYPTDGKQEVKGLLDSKTPSQRLRAVLFVLWKQETDKQCELRDFNQFYIEKMERLIDKVKEQINPQ